MKNKLLLIIFLLVISSIKGQELQISAEPPNWWVGMKSNQLQLMIHSKNISEYDVRIDEPRIKLIKVNNTDNPNYLFIDLEIIEENDPFDFEILFFNSKDSFSFKYPLNKRSRPIDLHSFNSYRPISLGVRAKLVDLKSGEFMWAIDESIDAGDASVMVSANAYQRGKHVQAISNETRNSILQSPRLFSKFVAFSIFQTLPKR